MKQSLFEAKTNPVMVITTSFSDPRRKLRGRPS
jgi:hypothetical protein